jgi:hypothetical protein
VETELPILEVCADPLGAEVVLTFELAEASQPAAVHLQRAVQAFVDVGQRGGFARQSSDPGQTSVAITTPLGDRDHALYCKLEVKDITARAFQLLRHMAAASRREGVEVLRVTVADYKGERSLKPVPAASDENEDLVYPMAMLRPGFKVVHEEIPASQMRRCLVETVSSPDSLLGDVADWLKPWFELLELGAFIPPVAEPDFGQSVGGSAQIFDEATIEVVVDRFDASENAWNVLLNMLARLHRAKVPLRQVTIA